MPEDKPGPPLTPEQTRQALKHLTSQFLAYGEEIAVLRRILLEKGLVSENEILETSKVVRQEGEEQIQKILSARRQKSSGGFSSFTPKESLKER